MQAESLDRGFAGQFVHSQESGQFAASGLATTLGGLQASTGRLVFHLGSEQFPAKTFHFR